jgi:hypothetical protein
MLLCLDTLRPALSQLALRSARRPTLHPLPSSNLLLSLRNVVQSLTRDGLISMLLRLSGGSTRCRSVGAGNLLLLLGDLGNGVGV